MLKFGLPLVPSSICAFIMHHGDSFLIRYFSNLDSTGIYKIGYRFPMLLNIILLGSFNYIWQNSLIYKISHREDANYQYKKITTYIIIFYIFGELIDQKTILTKHFPDFISIITT